MVENNLNYVSRHQPLQQEILKSGVEELNDQDNRGNLVVGEVFIIIDGPEELFTLLHVEDPGNPDCDALYWIALCTLTRILLGDLSHAIPEVVLVNLDRGGLMKLHDLIVILLITPNNLLLHHQVSLHRKVAHVFYRKLIVYQLRKY